MVRRDGDYVIAKVIRDCQKTVKLAVGIINYKIRRKTG